MLITLIAYSIVFLFFKTPFLFIPFFIGGVLIDLDHCVDYYLRYRKPTFSHKELSDGLAPYKHFIVPFHSYEFLFGSTIICGITQNPILPSFIVGLYLHMILDIVFNRYESIQAFSLTYRLTHWWNDVCSNTV